MADSRRLAAETKKPRAIHTHRLFGRDSTYCGAKPGFHTVTDWAKVTCPKCRRNAP